MQKHWSSVRETWKPTTKPLSGVLARYAKTVEQANLGSAKISK